ncbi:TrbI/VirB10 family protein [Sphingomonas sp. DT-204]|uniref:TrbI/VirB10 family protein n=1 Tax=Sphingomonas sp. DT-204 TaxID=3396166 RepID=UPI003F1DC8D7
MTQASHEDASAARPAHKVDPETLVLRASPARAIRFKRGVVIAIAGAASVGVATTAWFSLTPGSFHLTDQQDDKTVLAKSPSDTLSALPGSYAEVPKLGPPLPGDLGRPILNQQRAAGVAAENVQPTPAEQAAAAERERELAERKAARQSGVLVHAGARSTGPGTPMAAPPQPASEPREPRKIAFDPERDANEQQRKADLIAATSRDSDINPHVVTAAPSPYTLLGGSIIAASLVTGLNSDLPGLVVAQVTENVYDTVTGRTLLIPQGSRLIGSYDSVVAFGQSRALLVWQRIILPDGSSVRIDNLPATDATGYAGLEDQVDFHTWQLLKGVALSTLLGIGTEVSIGDDRSDLVRAIRESSQQTTAQAGQQIVSKQLNVQPTIKVRPGWPLRVIVHKDIVLRPWAPK